MNDTLTLLCQYDEHEEYLEFRGLDSEEIACDDLFSVVLKECLPCGGGGGTSMRAVFLYRGFGHFDADLVKFPDYAR